MVSAGIGPARVEVPRVPKAGAASFSSPRPKRRREKRFDAPLPPLYFCVNGFLVAIKRQTGSRKVPATPRELGVFSKPPKFRKRTAAGVSFHRSHGAAARSTDAFNRDGLFPAGKAPRQSTLARRQSGPCRGMGAGPQQVDFSGLGRRRKVKSIANAYGLGDACRYEERLERQLRQGAWNQAPQIV